MQSVQPLRIAAPLRVFRILIRQVLVAPHKLMNFLDMSSEGLIALKVVPLLEAALHTGDLVELLLFIIR